MEAVIFDLDGVVVSTDDYHYEAWKQLAIDEGIFFNRNINEQLRGVSRMESLEIILKGSDRTYSETEKNNLAETKNNTYRDSLKNLTENEILPGVMNFIADLKNNGIKIAIGSSSKNALYILKQIGLENYFDSVADGTDISNSKPDPEVFLLAAKRLNIEPGRCLVVEDADAGVEAAIKGNMKVLAVGYASSNIKADFRSDTLVGFTLKSFK